MSKGRVSYLSMEAVLTKGRLSLLEANTVSLVIPQGPDEPVESQTPVTLLATVASGVAEWEQTAGPTVTLTPSGNHRTFDAPATVDGAVLGFRVRSNTGGTYSSWAPIEVEVIAHQVWVKRASGLVPALVKRYVP